MINILVFHWPKYANINGRIVAQCKEIECYNHFWSFQMTALFSSVIIRMSYEVFVIILNGNYMKWAEVILFLAFPMIFVAQMIAYTSQCAAVHGLNKQIIAEERRLFIKFSRNLSKFRAVHLLKVCSIRLKIFFSNLFMYI